MNKIIMYFLFCQLFISCNTRNKNSDAEKKELIKNRIINCMESLHGEMLIKIDSISILSIDTISEKGKYSFIKEEISNGLINKDNLVNNRIDELLENKSDTDADDKFAGSHHYAQLIYNGKAKLLEAILPENTSGNIYDSLMDQKLKSNSNLNHGYLVEGLIYAKVFNNVTKGKIFAIISKDLKEVNLFNTVDMN